jgi:hypothetical protein
MSKLETIIDTCFAASPNVRYVAAYIDGALALRSRGDVQLLGSNESDGYEELIVNPTLLKLLRARDRELRTGLAPGRRDPGHPQGHRRPLRPAWMT